MVLLSVYLSFSIGSALNPDCSFVFEWANLLGMWNDANFCFTECASVSIQFLLLKVWLYPLSALSGDGEDHY